jgi:hypothetical protein
MNAVIAKAHSNLVLYGSRFDRVAHFACKYNMQMLIQKYNVWASNI